MLSDSDGSEHQRCHVEEPSLRLGNNVQLGYCGVDGVQGSAGAASCLVGLW